MGRYHTGTFPAVKPSRKVYMDVLRVIATVFVICVHTVALAKTTAAPGTLLFRVLEVFNYTFLSCNLFFVMISGALLLPVKGERCRDFFARRFIRVFIHSWSITICMSVPKRESDGSLRRSGD